MPVDSRSAILSHLKFLYGSDIGQAAYTELDKQMRRFQPPTTPIHPLDQTDAVLITYGDQFKEPGRPPLQTLEYFCGKKLKDLVSGVHILPFYPSSSDDGFSVIDYLQVDPSLGTWEDISRLGEGFRLMFDAVINHISQHSAWFQGFLSGDPRFEDTFITVPSGFNLSQVVRPRAHPLLTRFETAEEDKLVWTTFSADQVDLNYRNPRVLLDIIDILLEYVRRGAEIIRLDAIAYLWKEPGTTCIHLPQTHRIVQLLRAILDEVAPGVLLITETNVPHQDNLSYFGSGNNEAHLVYNFALPPLVLHAFLTGQGRQLSEWAAGLELPSPSVTFFNFLASHDGIGLNPARGILTETEISNLVQNTLERGGLVSSKANPDGSLSPYELNISYFSALTDPEKQEPLQVQVDRFLASQAILLAMLGLPGIYVHSLLGSHNWVEGARQTGQKRTINREKFNLEELLVELEAEGTRRQLIFEGYARLLRARQSSPAFHPYGAQQVLKVGEPVFGLMRTSPLGDETVLCLHNLSSSDQSVQLSLPEPKPLKTAAVDLLSQQQYELEGQMIPLRPYQILWLIIDV